jgi:hypothetical protein
MQWLEQDDVLHSQYCYSLLVSLPHFVHHTQNRQRRWKEEISFSKDKTSVDFLQYKSYEFDCVESGGREDDVITLVNAPVLVSEPILFVDALYEYIQYM